MRIRTLSPTRRRPCLLRLATFLAFASAAIAAGPCDPVTPPFASRSLVPPSALFHREKSACVARALARPALAVPAASIQWTQLRLYLLADGTPAILLDQSAPNFQAALNASNLGTVSLTYTATAKLSNVRLIAFLDLDIDQPSNGFSNEYATFVSLDLPPAAPAGATAANAWEIDEPGFLFGNILTNVIAGRLDNSNAVPGSAPDDVSFALQFPIGDLQPTQSFTTQLRLDTANIGGLQQTDPDSNLTVYLNGFALKSAAVSTLSLTPTVVNWSYPPTGPVPSPANIVLTTTASTYSAIVNATWLLLAPHPLPAGSTPQTALSAVPVTAGGFDIYYNPLAGVPNGPLTATVTVSDGFGSQRTVTVKLATNSLCDINVDGLTNVVDVQLVINEALGVSPAVHDLSGDGAVNVVDVQIDINAALGLGCTAVAPKVSTLGSLAVTVSKLPISTAASQPAAQPDLTITGFNKTSVVTDTQTLAISGTLAVTVSNIGASAVSIPFRILAWEDRDGDGQFTQGTDVALGSLLYSDGLAVGASAAVALPLNGKVLFRGNCIYVQVDYGNAVAETNEANNISNTGQFSTYVPTGDLNPVVKWNKSTFAVRPDSYQVMMTPAVIDLNGDGIPDIVFSTFTGANYETGGILRAISGKDGAELWSVTDPRYLVRGEAGLAIGDIDGDGKPEIVAVHESLAMIAFKSDGTFAWLSPVLPGGEVFSSDQFGGPSIADLHHDGTPEIIMGATVLRNDGSILWQGTYGRGDNTAGAVSVVADLDLDGTPEIVAGNTAYRADGSVYWRNTSVGDGFNAVGNFNADPYPEVVLVTAGQVYLLSHTGAIIWGPVAIPGGGYGGPPTVADLDGDGIPEIGVAGGSYYVVFNADGSIKWKSPTQDASSSMTGSSVFDFNGDGSTEVIYGDEVFLRIYRGSDGAILYQLPKGSGTTLELPVIVDVDGDGKADIVAVANTWYTGAQNGIFVISGDNWANTRKIWNQHAYHVTNVNDDGTIPKFEQANWLTPGLNNFRLNTFEQPQHATAAPDLTASDIRKNDSSFPASVQLTARIGNGGATGLAPNLITNGSFEFGNPPCQDGFTTLASGSQLITGWTVAAATVDYTGAYWQAGDGRCSIDLTGTPGTGAIQQSAPTISGHTYQVGFLLAANPECEPTIKTMLVSAAGASQMFSVDATGKSTSNMGYMHVVWQFVATGPTTVLRFDSLVSGFCGPVIDGVEMYDTAMPGNATVAFYNGDPAAGGTLIGTTQTSQPLQPGQYEDVSITWNNPPAGLHPIVVVADPDNVINEGDETNNKAGANILLGVGPFPTVDDLLTRFKDKTVDLRWSAIPGATGYNIYRRTASIPSARVRSGGAATAFSDTNLTNSTVYYYSVRWLNAQGLESGDGTEASATPDTVLAPDTAPTILSAPVVRAIALAPYTYQVRAEDPDPGDSLSYSLQSPPIGMTVTTAGLVAWTPTVTQAGYIRVQVQVTDSHGRFSSQSYALFTDVQNSNAPPIITSTPITLATSGELYGYQVLGRDPENGLLFFTLVAAPAGMSINQSTGLIQWVPARSQVGNASVTLRATDFGGLPVAQSFTIAVSRGNKAPAFTSSAIMTASVSLLYSYQATAADPDGDPVTFSLASGPAGLSITPAGLVQWTPANAQLGMQTVSLRVTDDSGANALQNYTVMVRPPNHPPTIASTPLTAAAVATLYSYQATATDPDLPNDSLLYSLTAAPAGMAIGAATGLVQWTPTAALLNTDQRVTLQVADLSGAAVSQSFLVHVGPQDLQRPTVSLSSPVNGAVLTSDTPIVGSVQDNNLTSWILEYRTVDSATWTTLATGASPVNNGQLGTLAATLLANDVYRLRLTGQDAGGSVSTPEIEVRINTRQLKMGDFTLSFEDMRIPGFTFPISILRKYDSKRPAAGDFGPGWTLAFSETAVRVDASDNVFITLPDGRRVSFQFTPQAEGFGVADTVFTPQNGVYDQLQNLDCAQVFGGPGNWFCNGFQGWQPTNWKLTTKEGLIYTIAGSTITRMEDRAGNWIQISPASIVSSTGRNVTIERNAQNLVTRIVAPPNGSAPGSDLHYQYDAQSRLTAFLNQTGNVTTFAYENPAFPYYLTKVTDPLGRQLVRNVFNTQGQLIAQCDPNGNIVTLVGCSQFNPQPGTNTFTAINGRGYRTDLISDANGNVLSERHFLDATTYLETLRTYDANNNLLTERDPEGNLKSYTYDARGNKLTDTDQGGRTTTYTYAPGCDKVATATDPAGNVTTYTYDAACNLRFVMDALQHTTEYRYNAAAQRTRMIDPNGTTWTWAYGDDGSLQTLTDPFGKVTTFTFDASGNLLSRTDRLGRRMDFQYDAANRPTRETWDNGHVGTYTYDAGGLLLTAVDPDSSLTMAYDNLGRLLSVDNFGTPNAPRVVMTYGYDANGNVTTVQDSLGGLTNYSYDQLDRLSQVMQSGTGVQPKRVDMTYNAASLLTQLKRYGDLGGTLPVANTSYEYDCGGCVDRLTAIRHRKASDNSVIHDLTFARDPRGNISNSTDAEGSHIYAYDALRRLTSATQPIGGIQPNESYSYDAVGNRLTSHLSYFYTYSWQTTGAGNRLLQDSQFDYAYDDEGNLSSKRDRASSTHTDFTYDYRNRMVLAIQSTPAGNEIGRLENSFDTVNRRIRSSDAGQTSFFAYDGPNPISKVSSSGGLINRRLYGRPVDSILADEVSGITRWFLVDQVGTVRDLVTVTGSSASHGIYDSFGVVAGETNRQAADDIGYASREVLSFDGYSYYRDRLYAPQLGRFTQEDPLSSFDYSYANANPLVNRDPFGLDASDLTISLRATQALSNSLDAQVFLSFSRAGLTISGALEAVVTTQQLIEAGFAGLDLGHCLQEPDKTPGRCIAAYAFELAQITLDAKGFLYAIFETAKKYAEWGH